MSNSSPCCEVDRPSRRGVRRFLHELFDDRAGWLDVLAVLLWLRLRAWVVALVQVGPPGPPGPPGPRGPAGVAGAAGPGAFARGEASYDLGMGETAYLGQSIGSAAASYIGCICMPSDPALSFYKVSGLYAVCFTGTLTHAVTCQFRGSYDGGLTWSPLGGPFLLPAGQHVVSGSDLLSVSITVILPIMIQLVITASSDEDPPGGVWTWAVS